jgi:hypothetical protein
MTTKESPFTMILSRTKSRDSLTAIRVASPIVGSSRVVFARGEKVGGY